MTNVRIVVTTDESSLDITEYNTLDIRSDPTATKVDRVMQRAIARVNRAYGIETPQ